MVNVGKIIFFIVHLVLGIYLINFGFNFIEIPSYISELDSWIITVSGVLVVLGGINYVRASSHSKTKK